MSQDKHRVLIVDVLESAIPLERLLTQNGYSVKVAFNRIDTLEIINTWKPHLIAIDIFCPHFPILDFVKELEKTPGFEDQKIVFLASHPDIDLITGKNKIISAYLNKPIDFAELEQILRERVQSVNLNKKPEVLVLDGEINYAELMGMFLETKGYIPVVLSTCAQALEYLKNQTPSAIIFDPLLSDMDNFEKLKLNILDERFSNIPIITVSGIRFNEFQQKGHLTGYPEYVADVIPDDFVLKWFESILQTGQDEGFGAHRPTILLADDEAMLLDLVGKVLDKSGFNVIAANDGVEAMEQIRKYVPDIIVSNHDMPRKDGLTLAKELKENPAYAHLPIIIFSGTSSKPVKLKALSLGIDDYMTKPIDTDELVARVQMILKRNKQVMDANPLTKLPGNPSIQAKIEQKINIGDKFAVLYADLNQFKAYNDAYGFDAGDKVIKATANVLLSVVRQGDSSDFIGHIGGDDFIVVTSFDKSIDLAKKIISSFDAVVPSFYNEEDRKRGYIISKDRQNKVQKFPFISVAIGIVHNNLRELTSLGQISQIGGEVKHHAKSMGSNSSYFIDRRTE
jgi:diguanylate cyclase (GGDEF)-like protein